MTRRRMAAATAAVAALSAAAVIIWHRQLFGPGTWGAGGNLVAWAACGGLAFGWTHIVMRERHIQAMAQAARLHQQRLEQAEDHHQALVDHITATAGGDPA